MVIMKILTSKLEVSLSQVEKVVHYKTRSTGPRYARCLLELSTKLVIKGPLKLE